MKRNILKVLQKNTTPISREDFNKTFSLRQIGMRENASADPTALDKVGSRIVSAHDSAAAATNDGNSLKIDAASENHNSSSVTIKKQNKSESLQNKTNLVKKSNNRTKNSTLSQHKKKALSSK
ncbi:hypothetical protein ACFOLJ_17620 [Rugamonas sp. CCM 8940]|uniref:hypothetical protein n=1 Tax=Rugamonas sp. CCM 8940 TaxID=2765359 RepID=UPI0018F511B9|nr:hypothetical protein [Rugamonas sp. CCM 8940]MBJ7310931.1 hypothetical protein [Rugamonas sp. CCM 8940]